MAVFASFCIPFPPSTLMWQMTTVAKDGFVQKELCQTLPLASWHDCIHRLSTRLNGRKNALLVGREEALAERNILCFLCPLHSLGREDFQVSERTAAATAASSHNVASSARFRGSPQTLWREQPRMWLVCRMLHDGMRGTCATKI